MILGSCWTTIGNSWSERAGLHVSDVHHITPFFLVEISIHGLFMLGDLVTVNMYLKDHGFISLVFPIHSLFTGQFTDEAKPLSDPVLAIG